MARLKRKIEKRQEAIREISENINMYGMISTPTSGQISKESSDGCCGNFIIYSNARWKIIWDVCVMALLIIVCLIVPYRIAFTQEET